MKVNGYPADKLDEALEGVKVIVIPAGVPRKVSCVLSLRGAFSDFDIFSLV